MSDLDNRITLESLNEVLVDIQKSLRPFVKPPTLFERWFKPIIISVSGIAVIAIISAIFSFVKMQEIIEQLDTTYVKTEQFDKLVLKVSFLQQDINYNSEVIADKLGVRLKFSSGDNFR